MLSVIIVSYNTRDMTLDCLRTLLANADGVDLDVIVVDNASADGSVEAIRRAYPDVRVLANEANVGFGAANNQGARQARGDLLLLLNSDAFVTPGALSGMLRCLADHERAGVVGPRLANADGSLQRSCFRLPSPLLAWCENLWVASALPDHPVLGNYRKWPHDAERAVEYVIGACMLVRRDVYEAAGGFDEAFFMYSEEADLQKRIREAGWEIRFTPCAVVTHLGGASAEPGHRRINPAFYDGHDRFFRKHYGAVGLASYRLASLTGSMLRAAGWSLAWLVSPRRRATARYKARLYAWLTARQAFRWRGPKGVASR